MNKTILEVLLHTAQALNLTDDASRIAALLAELEKPAEAPAPAATAPEAK